MELFSDQPTSEIIRINSGILKTGIVSKPWLARDVWWIMESQNNQVNLMMFSFASCFPLCL
jgi:hypothetical protein